MKFDKAFGSLRVSIQPDGWAATQDSRGKSTEERVPGEPASAVHWWVTVDKCAHGSGLVSSSVKWGRESRQGVV